MRKIKVLLALRPRMLLEVVRHIVARQPDMEVVGELINPIGLLLAMGATAAEMVITTPCDSERESGLGSSLLVTYPHLKILALSATSDTAFLYEGGSPKQRIDNVGEGSLLRAIRAFMPSTITAHVSRSPLVW